MSGMMLIAERILQVEQELRAELEAADLFEVTCQIFLAASALAADLSPSERLVLGNRLAALANDLAAGPGRGN